MMRMKRLFPKVFFLALVASACLSVAVGARGVDTSLSAVSGGRGHTVCVTESGTVYGWGSNQSYQLGLSDTDNNAAPTEIKGLAAVSVACGYDFTAALYGGSVYTWGMSQYETPTEVALTGVTKIDAGQISILALRLDGTVWQWNCGGEPKQVAGLARIAEISAGGGHNLALTVDGRVYAWGGNSHGQLGDGTTTDRDTPVELPLMNIVDIAAGFSHSLAVAHDGTVYAWGNNACAQLGDGTREDRSVPTAVKGVENCVRVAAGDGNSLALRANGAVYAWGYGEYGQLGNGTNDTMASAPVRVNGLNDIARIECGVHHCMAVSESGVLYMWGRNRYGQISGAFSGNCNTPKRIRSGLSTEGSSEADAASGASYWAVSELAALYREDMVLPMLWSDYQSPLTRAEFAALLVSAYESITGGAVTESQTTRFTDLAGYPLEGELRKAVALGLLNGTTETTLSPDTPINRQEGAKLLCSFIAKARGAAIPTAMHNMPFYADASAIHAWAAPYVYYAYRNDIMKGGSDGSFDPLGGLTREQGLLMVQRVLAKYDWIE